MWSDLFRRHTLSRRILGVVLPAVLVMTVLMGVFSYTSVKRQILNSVQQEMNGVAQNTARDLEDYFRQRRSDLESFSESAFFAEHSRALSQGRADEVIAVRRQLQRYFASFAARSKTYYDIAFHGVDGRRVCGLRARSNGPPVEITAKMRRGETVDLPPQKADDGKTLVKRYIKPVFSDASQFLGVIVADGDLLYLEDVLAQVRVGPLGSVYVDDPRGDLLLGHRPPDFKKPLVGKARVGGTTWSVWVVSRQEDFLRRPLQQIFWLTMGFSVLATLILFGVIVGSVSQSMAPVQALADGTRRFAEGDWSYRFPEPKTVELSTLARSFNGMAQALEQRNRELEARLRQATALRRMEEGVIQRLDEETVLRMCLESVAKGFSFDRTGMYWVDFAHKEITGRYLFGSEGSGFSESAFRKRRVSLGGDDILNDVIRTRQAVIVRNPGEKGDARLNSVFVAEAKTREFVLAPIGGKDRVLGIISADNYFSGRPLVDSDREGLTLFANAVGLALENTVLFQNLVESESRYRAVLENSPEAVIGLSREHWITTWNRGAEKIFGYEPNDILGKPLTALFPKEGAPAFRQLLNVVMEKGSVRDFAGPGITRDGRALDLSISWGGSHPDFWMNREWTVVIRDVTDAKKLQQQLIRSEKLSAVGQLISGIAHELNNPLQAVVGYADILSDDMRQRSEGKALEPVKPEEVLGDLRIITDNAMRCQKIIENLLLFVRQGEIEKRPQDLERVLQASRDLLQYKLKKAANVIVEVNLPSRTPRVHGNFQQLQQIFVNLINNACDAMATAPGPKNIKISASEKTTGLLHVELADSGPGIPDAVKTRLFEPFFTTKAEGRGTGLGLAVCKQIIEDHGGKIGFHSEAGYGTTFWFDVPIAREETALALTSQPILPPVKGKTVLIVDDEPDVLSFLTKVIHGEGNQVDAAASLKDAAARVTARPYDLVVADIRLGEGTGLQLYEKWSLWSPHPRPPFLFMTGDVVVPSLGEELERKGLHLLHKPIDLGAFQMSFRQSFSVNQ
jgi:two-component system NtrC family sensor kinase